MTIPPGTYTAKIVDDGLEITEGKFKGKSIKTKLTQPTKGKKPMTPINQVMEENNFIIVNNIEEARILAKDVRERERHCTCIISLDEGKFTVWPEGYAMKAGIETVETFHMSEIETDGEREESNKELSDFGDALMDALKSGCQKHDESHRLMKFAIGCLLIRNDMEPLTFKVEEIDAMQDSSHGFTIEARTEGFTIRPYNEKEELH